LKAIPSLFDDHLGSCNGVELFLPLWDGSTTGRTFHGAVLLRFPIFDLPLWAMKLALFPGQFDPITNGHLDVIARGVKLFDELVVAVGINPEKREMFTLDERLEMVSELLRDVEGVRVEKYSGLTVDFARRLGVHAILRGIRDVSDLRYEFQLALANRAVGGVETVFIMTGDQYALTSSSLIRQVVSLGGDIGALAGLLPDLVVERLRGRVERGLEIPTPDAPPT